MVLERVAHEILIFDSEESPRKGQHHCFAEKVVTTCTLGKVANISAGQPLSITCVHKNWEGNILQDKAADIVVEIISGGAKETHILSTVDGSTELEVIFPVAGTFIVRGKCADAGNEDLVVNVSA